jgi:hypothetical protein
VAVSTGITWPAAKTAAAGASHNGFHGHLASITSAAENTFLVSNGLSVPFYWIGASQPVGVVTCPSCSWSWVTGEPFVYTNWAPGEPNDFYFPGSEPYLTFWNPVGTWNDQYAAAVHPGYVVEYDRPTTGDDCKQGGWQKYGPFKNQGDCVSWLATGGKNEPGKNIP